MKNVEINHYKILLIENDLLIAQMIIYILHQLNIASTLAQNTGQAIEIMENSSFDLVIIDINLEEESGISLLQEIRSNHQGTRIIVMTGDESLAIKKRLHHSNIFYHFTKPFHMKELLIVLTHMTAFTE